jgi:heptosyltransferase-3
MSSLVYHVGALGDFITVLPALERWRSAHRSDPLLLLGKPAHGALVPHLVDETWDVRSAPFAPLFSADPGLGPPAAIASAGVTSALLFASPASPLPAALRRGGLTEVVCQEPFPPGRIHVVDYHLSLFDGPIAPGERIPRVPTRRPHGGERAAVALHPGSGSREKNWPLAAFRRLSEELSHRGHRVAWIVGPAEEGIRLPSEDEAWRHLELTELAARLSACSLYVGNDSGVTHLAAATGCPTVALFGRDNASVWAPRGIAVHLVVSTTADVSGITPSEIVSLCLKVLGKQ